MCAVWAPFLPRRRWEWSSPGPRWLSPCGWVPFLVSSLLLHGFLDLVLSDLSLRRCPSTVIFEGQLTKDHENGKVPKQDLLVVSKDLCFGAPGPVRIDEPHNLEVQSGDCRCPLGVNRTFEQPLSAKSQYIWRTSCPHLVFTRYSGCAHACSSRVFSQFWVQAVFLHESIAMKQQSRSSAELSWENDNWLVW